MPLPPQLESASFNRYAPPARALAGENLSLLRLLPLAFTPFLLKEIVDAATKFPVERRELDDQLAYLKALSAAQLEEQMKPFASLHLNPQLQAFDWVNSPGQFLEQLSAHLWATHQMDTFRAASEGYVHRFHATLKAEPPAIPRAGVAVMGQGVADVSRYRPLQKLQREGVLYTNVRTSSGLEILTTALKERQQAHPSPYAHWCIHGGDAPLFSGFSTVSYGQLQPARSALAAKMLDAYQGPHFDPEMLRTNLARTSFESLHLKPSGDDVLDRFSLSLLTEGSGTQIYSTTFVQWAAREALRRAQPLTLYTHYTPRIRERSMAEMLSSPGNLKTPEADPVGSLIDAGMGAYYTWMNQQRLPGDEQARFLAWLENGNQAVLIAPGQKRGAVETRAIELAELARLALPTG